MGDELSSATDIARLFVFQDCLRTPNLTLIKTPIIVAVTWTLALKCIAKKWKFLVCLDISARSSRILELFGPAYTLLSRQGQCSQFQALSCSD